MSGLLRIEFKRGRWRELSMRGLRGMSSLRTKKPDEEGEREQHHGGTIDHDEVVAALLSDGC